MNANRPSSAVRRGIFVETASVTSPSSVGAAYSDVAPDGAWRLSGFTLLQICRTYGAALNSAAPPLAEQKRIVARVEALLRQCDALEAQLRQTRTLGAHLLDSTLHHLLAA